MRKNTFFTLIAGSLFALNVFAADQPIKEKDHVLKKTAHVAKKTDIPHMDAVEALVRIQKINPGPYNAIQLVKNRQGAMVYMAYHARLRYDHPVMINSRTGAALSGSYIQDRYDLNAVLGFVSQTYEGNVLSARKIFLPSSGYTYLVKVESLDEQPFITELTISGNNLKIIHTKRYADDLEYEVPMDDLFIEDEVPVDVFYTEDDFPGMDSCMSVFDICLSDLLSGTVSSRMSMVSWLTLSVINVQ